MKHSGVWTLAEADDGRLKDVSFELLRWGKTLAEALGEPLTSVVLGHGLGESETQALIERGADRVLVCAHPVLRDASIETQSRALSVMIRQEHPAVIIAAATTTGRSLLPHLAAKLGTGLTADCTELCIDEKTGDLMQVRPAIGGNIMARIRTPHHRPQMATVRPHSALPLPADPSRWGEVEVVPFCPEWQDTRVRRIDFTPFSKDEGIRDAEVVIAGGAGIRKGENVSMLRELAGLLGGKVGASRTAVDRGWCAYSQQVGLSGKTVTPRHYLAVGISGAIQHLAGMKTAETIAAINSDPDALIFKVADFGIVGDLFEVLPLLIDCLRKERTPRPTEGNGE